MCYDVFNSGGVKSVTNSTNKISYFILKISLEYLSLLVLKWWLEIKVTFRDDSIAANSRPGIKKMLEISMG